MEEGAGTEFEPDLARTFVQMMHSWDGRVQYLENADTPIGSTDTLPTDNTASSVDEDDESGGELRPGSAPRRRKTPQTLPGFVECLQAFAEGEAHEGASARGWL